MRVTVYGAGYVGLVTAVCLAEIGHDVICVEIDQAKLGELKSGRSPIYEEGLDELLCKNITAKRLSFSEPNARVVKHGELQFITVGTPTAQNHTPEMKYVNQVAAFIGQHLDHDALIANKSTVPVGTTITVEKIIRQNLKTAVKISVVSNPEFLREGQAIRDFMNPERIIVGSDNPDSFHKLKALYAPLIKHHPEKFITMQAASAELTKYAANTFLAMKVSFINEIAEIAEQCCADIVEVKKGIGSDSRIGSKFLNAGCGFGGSCFPKDVKALLAAAKSHGLDPCLIESTLKRNEKQKRILFDKILAYHNNKIKGKTFCLWGLAFKPNTDDIRSSVSCRLIELLTQAGAIIKAYDPLARNNIAKKYAGLSSLILCDNKYQALENAEGLIIVTEWDEFKSADLSIVKNTLSIPVIFDGRNAIDRNEARNQGIRLINIGVRAHSQLQSHSDSITISG